MNPRTKQGREELRVLCENATPGPWRYRDRLDDGTPHCDVISDTGDDWTIVTGDDPELYDMEPADAIFIARARTALPEALDALEAAEAVIEAARIVYGAVQRRGWDDANDALGNKLAAYDAKRGAR